MDHNIQIVGFGLKFEILLILETPEIQITWTPLAPVTPYHYSSVVFKYKRSFHTIEIEPSKSKFNTWMLNPMAQSGWMQIIYQAAIKMILVCML